MNKEGWSALAGARGVMALVVVGAHAHSFTRDEAVRTFARMSAFAAVVCFLVISGYSIAASLDREPRGFYGRRALRIMPVYILGIVAAMLCTMPFGGVQVTLFGYRHEMPNLATAVANLFFLQGFTAKLLATNGVVWTLSIEVACYLIAPALRKLSLGAVVAIGAASLGVFVAAGALCAPHYSEMLYGGGLASLGWCWILGFLCWRIRDNGARALTVIGVCTVAFSLNGQHLYGLWPLSVVITGVAFWGGRLPRAVRWCADVAGDTSYPLYLIHIPLFVVLSGYGLRSGVLYVVAAVIVAIGVDWLYDRPIKALVKSALRRSAPAMPAPAQDLASARLVR